MTVEKYTLENGLEVWLKEIHTAPLISHWTWYRVGSRNELPGRTGISHWVEHMQFKGTAQFPTGVLEKAVSRCGGVWNAFTFLDWTTYFQTLPADQIDLALRMEPDRMVNSQYDPTELESERTVVISELEGGENEPMVRLDKAVQEAAFQVHPYHHEVIGSLEDLQHMTRSDLLEHYHTFYNPSNALIAIAGDFSTPQILARLNELYRHIPAREIPPQNLPPEPASSAERYVEVKGPGETTYLQVAYHSPAAAHPDFFPLTVADSLLTGPSSLNMFGGGGVSNKTTRLYRRLVEKELVIAVNGGLQATIDPFLYEITMVLYPGRDPQEVLKVLDEEIARMSEEPVSEEEISRAVKQARALFAYGSESITNQGFWMGYANMFASYRWFENYVEELQKTTPAQVQQAARRILNPANRVIGLYLPDGSGEEQME